MTKLNGILDNSALGVGLDLLEASFGVFSWANIETRLCTENPRPPSSQLCMDEDGTTNWTKQSFVKVEGSLEKFPRTDPWIECGLPKKIEGEFSMWQKKVPKVQGSCGINAGQYFKEVILEGANSTFSLVAAMHI